MLLIAEPVILTGMVLAFWHHSPPIRDTWVGLLWLAIPVFRLRMVVHNRLWTYTLLLDTFLVFILVSAVNFHHAPLSRAAYPVLICRPLMGFWLYVYATDHSRTHRTMRWLMLVSLTGSLILAVVALTASDWVLSKASVFESIISVLPVVDYGSIVPDMFLRFNVNEIAGAIAWLCPLMAGFMLYRPVRKADTPASLHRLDTLIAPVAGVIFLMLFVALMLGQSRFAIAGVLIALTGIVWFGVTSWQWKYGLIALLIGIGLFQGGIVLGLFSPPEPTPVVVTDGDDSGGDGNTVDDSAGISLSARDNRSMTGRMGIWEAGLKMMLDYPLTGVGMSMYRSAVQQPAYHIDFFDEMRTTPPHAHNEWLQAGADMGIPGILFYAIWYGLAAWMLWRGWQGGDTSQRALVLAIGGGLLAHAIYGLGDAITLWDRFKFLFWWMLALAGAQFTCLAAQPESEQTART